ncbi:hypothetical protein LINGRAHAP2_LOCUS13194 [Linum grandiflorum]
MAVEAKACDVKTWDCKGQQRCFDDCKRLYNGTSICDPPIGPFVPYQCVCRYNC